MNILELFELLGVDASNSADPWAFIDGLIDNCTLSEEIKQEMHSYNNDDTPPEVMELMLRQLFDNQVDRIQAGFNYNQSDIKRKLKQL